MPNATDPLDRTAPEPAPGGAESYITLREAGLREDVARDVASSEALLRTVIDTSLDGFFVADLHGRFIDVNPAFCRMTGLARNQLLLQRIVDVEATMSPDEISARLRELRAHGAGHFETALRGREGARVDVEVAVTFAGPERGLLVCFVRDVTERKRADAALAESEARYRRLVDNLNAGVLVVGRDRRVRLANARAGFLLGLDHQDLPGRELVGLGLRLVGEDGEPLPEDQHPGRLVLATGTPVVNHVVGVRREGVRHTVWLLLSAYPVHSAALEIRQVVLTFVDISRRKETEAALAETRDRLAIASRLAAMGTLVGGVAHEINNPLAATLSGLDSARDDLRAAEGSLDARGVAAPDPLRSTLGRAREAVEDAQAGARRVSRIVKDLIAFGRPDPRRTRAHVLDVVQEALRWLPVSVGRSGEITVDVVDRGAPDVTVSAGQLEQVLVNLVTNAAKAIPDGRAGRIEIACGPGPGGTARVEVKDDGAGIPAEILPRVFDPFFTTRPVGENRGTGLGLAICHAIVTAHGGTLTAESTVGKGSTFRLELPPAA